MNPKTLEALHGSIAKWQAIVDETGVDEGPLNCPLCQVFYYRYACVGCPVHEKTTMTHCEGTPYDLYSATHNKIHAQAELDFLKSLVPEEGRNR